MQTKPHVLFAEDDPDTREMMHAMLRQEGFRVSVTANGSEALSLVITQHFDALLLDNWMPDLTGIELCREIRTFDQTTPIFFCSGAAMEADKNAALLAGAQGYFEKPLDVDRLIETLRSALNIGSSRAQAQTSQIP